jgi:hypothetical protein
MSARELEAAKVAEFAAGGNWMWACAQSVEKNQPLNIYAYADQNENKWLLDPAMVQIDFRTTFSEGTAQR